MNDLGEYLKQCLQRGTVPLQNLHKKKGDNFGTLLEAERREQKNNELNHRRKEERSTLLVGLRQIDANMSPITPQPQVRTRRQAAIAANEAANNAPVTKKMPARLEMLAKWKEEKTKRIQEAKQKARPPFKVCHVAHPVGLPDLNNVNVEIKGKRFVKSKFAPDNHQFRPPANIKPIDFVRPLPIAEANQVKKKTTNNGKPETRRRQDNKKTPIKEKRSRLGRMGKAVELLDVDEDAAGAAKFMLNNQQPTDSVPSSSSAVSTRTRNRTNSAAQQDRITKTQNKKKETPKPAKNAGNKNSKTTKSRTVSTSIKQNGEEAAVETEHVSLSERTLNRTPVRTAAPSSHNAQSTTPVYISPFVTVSRGKDSARKEYESRRSRGGMSLVEGLSQYTSPTAGAKYFAAKLDCEIARLERICDGWNQYKAENNPPEEVVSMINVAVGQCSLLITKKFQQFRGLINECRSQTSEMAVTCTDLHGFWDMMYLQVENVEQRFANLDQLKASNWEILLPQKPERKQEKQDGDDEKCSAVNRQKTTKAQGGDGERVGAKKAKAPAASSTLREAIRAARRKKQIRTQSDTEIVALDTDNSEENVTGASMVNGETTAPSTNSKRKSTVLQSIVLSETKKRNSSPGLLMMKVAQFGKALSTDTPARSILKMDVPKSSARKSKAVLFKEDSPNSAENTENDLNRSNTDTNKSMKEKTPLRRSTRLSRTKLF